MSEATTENTPRPATQDDHGNLLPARLELVESSGPVSPRYQYSTRVLVTCAAPGAEPLLTLEHAADYVGGVPTYEMNRAEPLPRERFERLWADLLAEGLFALGGDLAADRRDRTGVSFNHVEVVLGEPEKGGTSVRFDYLLSQLTAHPRHRAVVEILKALVPPAQSPE